MSAAPSYKPLPATAKKVFTGKIFDVWQWEQTLFDGSTATFERLTRHDYAYAVGVLPNKKILIVEDEQPDRDSVLTPAGGGVNDGETPDAAVQREFLEETGYQIGELIPWHTYEPSYKLEMTVYAYIGRSLTKVGVPQQAAGERVRLVPLRFDEFLALGQNPRVRDWLLRIKLLEAQLDGAKRDELHALLFDNWSSSQ